MILDQFIITFAYAIEGFMDYAIWRCSKDVPKWNKLWHGAKYTLHLITAYYGFIAFGWLFVAFMATSRVVFHDGVYNALRQRAIWTQSLYSNWVGRLIEWLGGKKLHLPYYLTMIVACGISWYYLTKV